jgi:hypothetical protein
MLATLTTLPSVVGIRTLILPRVATPSLLLLMMWADIIWSVWSTLTFLSQSLPQITSTKVFRLKVEMVILTAVDHLVTVVPCCGAQMCAMHELDGHRFCRYHELGQV